MTGPDRVVVRVAQTTREREAIYRFRYEVYVDELNKAVSGIDHDRRRLHDDEDDAADTVLLYTGTPDEVTGTLRIRLHPPGTTPPEIRHRFSLDFFPGLDTLTIAETSRLMVTQSLRGGMLLAALARAAYRLLAERRAYLTFAYCAPSLLVLYRRLGYREYPGHLIPGDDGLRIPLVNLIGDVRHYREVGSPLLREVQEAFPPATPAPFDVSRYAKLIATAGAVDTDEDAVWDQLQSSLRGGGGTMSLFDDLPDTGLRTMLSSGYILRTPANQVVSRAQLVEQEIFVVLDGSFEEFTADGRRLDVLTAGHLLGEMSLFVPGRRRATSIRSLTAGRLLVLSRRFLHTLRSTDPSTAATLLHNLGRLMAVRLARLSGAAA